MVVWVRGGVTGACVIVTLFVSQLRLYAQHDSRLTPSALRAAWRRWAEAFQELAWEGVYTSNVEEIVYRKKTASSSNSEVNRDDQGQTELEKEIRSTYHYTFLCKWPEIVWRVRREETITRPGQRPTSTTKLSAGLLRQGRLFVLTGSENGWVVRSVLMDAYDPAAPPDYWTLLTAPLDGRADHKQFRSFVCAPMRYLCRYLDSGRLRFDRVESTDEGLAVEWHLELEGLPENERVDLTPWQRGRWILDPNNSYMIVHSVIAGPLYHGGTSRQEVKVRYRRYRGVPLMTGGSLHLVLEDEKYLNRFTSQWSREIERVSTEVDRSKLTLTRFGLPDELRIGPPTKGVPRWSRLLVAAVALLICGMLLWWVRSRKTAL